MTHMTLHEDMTLREMALERPSCIPLLERFGLDYCCGGDATLREAAAAKGLELAHVLRRLEAYDQSSELDAEQDWRRATMTDLADHIEEKHHAFVRRALARLDSLMPKVGAAHGGEHPELEELAVVIQKFADEMMDHMVREERVLFPWLRRLERKSEIQGGPPWSVQRPISCMIHDHDATAEDFRVMRRLTNDFTPPEGACRSFRELYSLLRELEQDTHVHIHKENNILFPAGVKAEAARFATQNN